MMVDSGLHNTKLLDAGSYLVEGPKVALTERHAKVRRDGYRKQQSTVPKTSRPSKSRQAFVRYRGGR